MSAVRILNGDNESRARKAQVEENGYAKSFVSGYGRYPMRYPRR